MTRKEIDLGNEFDTVAIKVNGILLEIDVGGESVNIVCMNTVAISLATNINKPQTSTAIAAAQEVYKLCERLSDGSIYVGLSATTGKKLVTTSEDIGFYNRDDALEAVAKLNLHGGGGWRLPTSGENGELNRNLFENRYKGKLCGTFNSDRNKSCYWASEFGKCQEFDSGNRPTASPSNAFLVRPVREMAMPISES